MGWFAGLVLSNLGVVVLGPLGLIGHLDLGNSLVIGCYIIGVHVFGSGFSSCSDRIGLNLDLSLIHI